MKMIKVSRIVVTVFFVHSCSSEDRSKTAEAAPLQDSIVLSSPVDTIIENEAEDSYDSDELIEHLAGTWICETAVESKEHYPDIDGLFDVEELKMVKLKGSFDPDFRGVVFWLESDSTLKVSTKYKPSDERKPYFERYSSAYYEKSVWHQSADKCKLGLEFHFNDGVDEVSKVHYSIQVKDNSQIKLVKIKNEFYVLGEEGY